jgi:hypothetical protein
MDAEMTGVVAHDQAELLLGHLEGAHVELRDIDEVRTSYNSMWTDNHPRIART